MAKNQNKIKFISLPKQLDVDAAISDKIEEVYGVCPYCGQSDEVLCCSYTDYMQAATNLNNGLTFEDSVSKEFFSKIKRSDFELEELQLNGKAPLFKTKMAKLYDWVRMLFYCPDCDCLWGSEKYPINLSSDAAVIQHIMEMHTQGYDSTALIALQNGFPTDLPNTRISYPDPESIPECPGENLDTADGTNNTKSQDSILSHIKNDLGIILSTVLNEFSSPACWDDSNKNVIVERNSKYKSYEIAKNLTLIPSGKMEDWYKDKFEGCVDTFRYNVLFDMLADTYNVYIEETEYWGGIYKESIPCDKLELDEWVSSDWHLTCRTIPITSRHLKYEKYKNVMY